MGRTVAPMDPTFQLMGGGPNPVVADMADGREVRAAGLVGAYSERMLVLGAQTHRLPDDLPFETACFFF